MTRLLRVLFSWVLKTSKDGDRTTSLGNLFHCPTDLIIKNHFLSSCPNLLFHITPIVSSYHHEKSLDSHSCQKIATSSHLSSRLNKDSYLSLSLQTSTLTPKFLSMGAQRCLSRTGAFITVQIIQMWSNTKKPRTK